MKRLIVLFCLGIATSAFGANGPCVVQDRGHFQIHTKTSGLFGAFGDEHLIQAKRIEGCAVVDPTDVTRSSIKLSFATEAIRVIDPKQDSKDRAKIQKTMETEVLGIQQYPQITFESTHIERGGGSGALRVSGNLTIRGKTQEIVVPVTLEHLNDGTYHAKGEYKFKQTLFGIKPIQLAGGTVKVKDEVETDFELFLK